MRGRGDRPHRAIRPAAATTRAPGACCRKRPTTSPTTVSLWFGAHTIKTGGSLTYDVTEQLFAPLQNGVYRFAGAPNVAPTPFQYDQTFALVPEARLMFPKAYVLTSFLQDDWRVANNLTLNLGLRYDIEWIKNVPDYPAPADKDNVDPRLGFAWDPTGDQRWAIRGGTGWFTQQHPIFTIVKGGVGGRNGLVPLNLTPTNPLFPTFPNAIPSLPPDTVLPIRSIQEISPTSRTSARGRRASASSARSAREPASRSTPTSTAARSTASSTATRRPRSRRKSLNAAPARMAPPSARSPRPTSRARRCRCPTGSAASRS